MMDLTMSANPQKKISRFLTLAQSIALLKSVLKLINFHCFSSGFRDLLYVTVLYVSSIQVRVSDEKGDQHVD